MSNIQKVEIVRPLKKRDFWNSLINGVIGLGIRTLIVWWAVASFFPELGLTFWSLLLAVAAVRMLTGNRVFSGRSIHWKKIFTHRVDVIEGTVEELHEYEPYKTDK